MTARSIPIACLFLALLPILAALPGPPPVPGDPGGTQVLITAPAQDAVINASSLTARYNHTAQETLYCLATIDSDSWADDDPRWTWPNTTKYAEVSPGTSAQASFSGLTQGDHALIIYCSDASNTGLWEGRREFAVSLGSLPPGNASGNNASVSILEPASTATRNLTLAYRHSAPAPVTCNVTLDGLDMRRTVLVPAGTTRRENFTGMPIGGHTFVVTCSNSSWSGMASKRFEVVEKLEDADDGGLTIRPRSVAPGGTVTIKGEFPPYAVVVVSVLSPDGFGDIWEADVGTSFETAYEVPSDALAGTYEVEAFSDTGEIRSGAFNVITVPSLALSSASVPPFTAFSIAGERFLPDADVTITISSKNTSRAVVLTDAAGSFLYGHAGLPAGKYTISAHSGGLAAVPVTLNVTGGSAGMHPPGEDLFDPPFDTYNDWQPPSTENDSGSVIEDLRSDPAPDVLYPEPASLDSPALVDEGSPYLLRLLIGLLILLVLAGGIGGYLVYDGSLDVSSWNGFRESAQRLMGHGPPTAPVSSPQETQKITRFILDERAKGYDDLTIRSALLAKGWEKTLVDHAFDALYRH